MLAPPIQVAAGRSLITAGPTLGAAPLVLRTADRIPIAACPVLTAAPLVAAAARPVPDGGTPPSGRCHRRSDRCQRHCAGAHACTSARCAHARRSDRRAGTTGRDAVAGGGTPLRRRFAIAGSPGPSRQGRRCRAGRSDRPPGEGEERPRCAPAATRGRTAARASRRRPASASTRPRGGPGSRAAARCPVPQVPPCWPRVDLAVRLSGRARVPRPAMGFPVSVPSARVGHPALRGPRGRAAQKVDQSPLGK